MPRIAVKKGQPPLMYLLAIADQKMQVQRGAEVGRKISLRRQSKGWGI